MAVKQETAVAEHPQAEVLQAQEAERARTYSESPRGDKQALTTRDILRKQPQVSIRLDWTQENEEAHRTGQALPYPKVEPVTINGVRYYIERGKRMNVPLQVAVVLMEAKKLHPEDVPDCPDKEVILREWAREAEERKQRYRGIGEGLVASVG